MSKAKGDQKRKTPQSIGEIASEMASSIAIQDARYQYFWNYKPIDKLLEPDGFFRSDKKSKALIGANKCLGRNQRVYDPVSGELKRVGDINRAFNVWSWDGRKLVSAKADRPFTKPISSIYKITFQNKETLDCSLPHEILCANGNYKSVALLLQESLASPLLTISGISPEVLRQDVCRCLNKVQDSQYDYRSVRRSCDEQLRPCGDNGQDVSPLRADAPLHIGRNEFCSSFFGKYNLDDSGSKLKYNLSCGRFFLRSIEHFFHHENLGKVFYAFCNKLKQNLATLLFGLQSIGDFYPLATRELCCHGFSVKEKAMGEVLSHTSGRRNESAHVLRQQVLKFQEAFCLLRPISLFEKHRNTPSSSESFLFEPIIIGVEYLCQDEVYDFNVPVFHNYYAGGVINHNSTKTTACVFETVMIYTGMVPPSMQGVYPHVIPKNRPRRVRIIVQDYSKHWPETIRPLLLGDPKAGAEGMLPEAWSDWDEETHMFTGPDGSYLSIVAVDPHEDVDPNVLRGPLIDHTMIDEINKEDVYTESLTRGASLKDGPKTVTLCFCPQEGYSCWTYDKLYGACYDSATKRRLPADKRHPDIYSQVVSMRDNPSIGPKELSAFISSLKPWEVAYRVNGEYSQRASNPYFNMEMLTYWEEKRMYSDGLPYKCIEKEVDLENGRFIAELQPIKEDDSFDEKLEAIWRIWKQPEENHKYVMVLDSAEGNIDSDNCVADIWDCTQSEKPYQTAQLRMRLIKPGDFAVQSACVATIYGKCLLVIEMNNTSGGICVDRIRNYGNLYRRVSIRKSDEQQTDQVGWHTDKFSKGPALETTYKKLNEIYSKHKGTYNPINSKFTLMEMQAFEEKIIRNARNVSQIVWAARKGNNDDTVLAMVIAFRMMYHEVYKISSCKLPRKASSLYSSENEKKAQQAVRGNNAFSGLKRKPSLSDLRGRYRSTKDVGIFGKVPR